MSSAAKPPRRKRRSMTAKPSPPLKTLPRELKQAINDIASRIEILVWVPFEKSPPPAISRVLVGTLCEDGVMWEIQFGRATQTGTIGEHAGPERPLGFCAVQPETKK